MLINFNTFNHNYEGGLNMKILFIGIPLIVFLSFVITKIKLTLKESEDVLEKNYVNRVKDLYRQSTR